jgi:hypothetical protein
VSHCEIKNENQVTKMAIFATKWQACVEGRRTAVVKKVDVRDAASNWFKIT